MADAAPPIIKEVVFAVPPERVYDAYAVKSELEKWFAQEATLDAVAGGTWRYRWPGEMAASGRILFAERPLRFVWTWEKSITGEKVHESMVINTYRFEAVDGGTRMRIEETGHASREERDMSEGGIDQMLRTLRCHLEQGQTVDWSAPQPSSC